eukprot:2638209-Rhodomonas_salina.1
MHHSSRKSHHRAPVPILLIHPCRAAQVMLTHLQLHPHPSLQNVAGIVYQSPGCSFFAPVHTGCHVRARQLGHANQALLKGDWIL